MLAYPAAAEEKAGPDQSQPTTIQGKVVAVHEELQLVVIGVGEADGVKVGMLFRAYRGDKFVAHLRVRSIFADMSVAAIEGTSLPVKPGDQLTTRFLDADTATASPEPNPPSPAMSGNPDLPKIRGRILGVDPRVDLVVFNLGRSHGIRTGQQLTVSRNGEWVATVVAQEVREKMAVGSVEYQKTAVQRDDLIVPRQRE